MTAAVKESTFRKLDSGVFSNTERNRFQSTTCSAEEHTQLQGRIARTIRKERKEHGLTARHKCAQRSGQEEEATEMMATKK